jgi:DNA-binding GntR family transcriptional regulator
LRMRNRIHQSLDEHRQIVRALEASDAEAAAHATREHVLIQGQRFTDLISMAAPGVYTPSVSGAKRSGAVMAR